MNKVKGISLVVLIITIVVIFIITGAVVMSITNNNPIKQASKLAFMTDLKSFDNELNIYNNRQAIVRPRAYSSSRLNADETAVTYAGVVDYSKTIDDILPLLESIPKYNGLFKIVSGDLVFVGTNTNQREWAEEMGIKVIIEGEPNVSINAISETIVKPGTDIVYTFEFSSNAGLSNINLDGNVLVLDDNDLVLSTQPDITIGTVTGTASDSIRSADITIKTTTLSNGTYKLRIKAGSVINENGLTNTKDTIVTEFTIDNEAPINPIMVANPAVWTNNNVTVTITYSADSVVKEYSTNGTDWNNYTTDIIVSSNNTTVYAKSSDASGNQSGQSTLTVANIEKDAPTVAYGTNGGLVDIATTTVTVSDMGGSALNTSTLQYVWDTQNITTPSSGWTTFINGDTITSESTSGTYYLWIRASDNAGNILVTKSNSFVIIEAPVITVNKPALANGMTAKKWNGSVWETVASPDTDTTWYNYDNKQWANAQTADGSMWVWIPRYEYMIPTPHSSVAQTIEVNFLMNTNVTATSGYTVHPAFTFGSTELTGIWVAKFEASGTTSAVDVKPGIAGLRTVAIDVMFTACRDMESNSRYGWGTSGIGIDTHLTKNTEWGAVAYLSQSVYGKNSEIWINPSSQYLTGHAGIGASVSGTTSTYPYDNVTYGVNASTTGNIYGVYDMSGGADEYTASYVNNGHGNLTTYGSSLLSATSQYKDVYISDGDIYSANYEANSGKKGDAVYETSTDGTDTTAWCNDYSYMPDTDSPFFIRGGHYATTVNGGVFDFDYYYGSGNGDIGFRPVLAVSAGI